MLAALWSEPEVQQLNNAPIDGLCNTNCIALCSKQNFLSCEINDCHV